MSINNVTTADNTLSPNVSSASSVSLRLPVLAIVVTIAATLALAFTSSVQDVTVSAPTDRVRALASRDIRFEDQADGSIRVIDATLREQISLVAPASNGFLRGAVRGLVRERKLQGLRNEVPFTLVALPDGRLVLHDAATGHEIDLASFGSTNAEVFAQLLVRTEKR
jgi:putative photosynthetic complex assembly protein